MSDQTVKTTMVLNDAQMLAEFMKNQRELLKTVQGFERLGKAGTKSGEQTGKGIAQATVEVRRFLVAMTGIGSAAAGVLAVANRLKMEYENLKQRQEAMRQASLTFEDRLAAAQDNFAGFMPIEQIRANAIGVSQRTNVTPSKVLDALGAAIAAGAPKSDKDAQDIFAVTEAALAANPRMPVEDITAMSQAVAILNKNLKRQGIEVTPEQAVGFVSKAQGFAPAGNLQQFAENAMPTISTLIDKKFTPQFAAALTDAVADAANDTQMRRSATGALTLAMQAEEQFGAKFPDLKGDELLRRIANDPQLREAFIRGHGAKVKEIDELHGEVRMIQALRDVMTPGTAPYRAAFEEIPQGMGTFADNERFIRDKIEERRRATPVAGLQQVGEGAIERVNIADQRQAQIAVIRDHMEQLGRAIGDSKFSQDIDTFKFELENLTSEMDPTQFMIDWLKRRATGLRADKLELMPTSMPGGEMIERKMRASPEDIRKAEKIEDILLNYIDQQRAVKGEVIPSAADLRTKIDETKSKILIETDRFERLRDRTEYGGAPEDFERRAQSQERLQQLRGDRQRLERELDAVREQETIRSRRATAGGGDEVSSLVRSVDRLVSVLESQQAGGMPRIEVSAVRGTRIRPRAPTRPDSKALEVG